ncbi:hypothetical protein F7R21_14735 [Burkholderia latens]|uniref:Uncharacterized protein n=1 Tax=Burkholderia latens TaxID=488446 RepID=A0A6H9TN33_9BURK|nr:hypothetical protein F7R21_14735 [Burkholderia latens]
MNGLPLTRVRFRAPQTNNRLSCGVVHTGRSRTLQDSTLGTMRQATGTGFALPPRLSSRSHK